MSEQNFDSWATVGAAIDGGNLYLEPAVASRCAKRCAEFVARLQEIRHDASALGKMDGFGGLLQSGVTLAAKFEKKAVGGDYSMDQAIADHMRIVEDMQRTFEKIEAMYSASEERGTAGINSAGSPL
ncbi:hypothetical protein O4215_21535 [Rhodococcus maanshanensis]|uniref:hypothetical protein n=1 Tax=Rhodococcus maanshanensis TaxID=183556 RepID=UPI0022B420BF|nr:hypothetical protein [Rhodococcus maanshanensis]MCZ4558147.1 hypothetical protein [Rhodococcus maanshanensis]